MIMIDDFDPQNIEIAEVAKKYGLQRDFMFFIDFKNMDRAIDQIKNFHSQGFRVGSHTVNHKSLEKISPEEVKFELEESKRIITELTGSCDWLAYPYGEYNQSVVEAVRKAGYKYARTTLPFDFGENLEYPAMHIGRIKEDKCDNKNSYEIAKRVKFEHYYLHLYDLYREKLDSFEQFDNFVRWYAKRED